MGNGNRGRRDGQRRRVPVPEMAPNLPDSMDDRPQPGRLSEATLDHLRPRVGAWTLLTAYLSLVRDLGKLDPADDIPPPDGSLTAQDEALREGIARGLRGLHPHMMAGYAHDAREIMTWIRRAGGVR